MHRETIEGYIRGFTKTRNRIAYDEALVREPSVLLPEAPVRAWREGFGETMPPDNSNTKKLFDAVDAALPAVAPEPWAVGDTVIKHTSAPAGEVVWVGPRGIAVFWPGELAPMSYTLGNGFLETFRRPGALDQPVPLPEETT